MFQSAVRFLILFVLTDTILLKLDFKKDIGFGQSSKLKVVYLTKMHHIYKYWEGVFDFQYKAAIGQCELNIFCSYTMISKCDVRSTFFPNLVVLMWGLSQ